MFVAGGYYHVINRGNDRAVVFHSPGDYRAFIELMTDSEARHRPKLLAFCLMPNHFHLVASPGGPTDLSRWMHWLTTTHAHRHHLRHGTSGCVWQGRFKSFPIKDDGHLLTVMRYVERNALRAGLADRAQSWPWGSLAWRADAVADHFLAGTPMPLPADWTDRVNEPQTPAELESLRNCVNRQSPFGDDQWVADAAISWPGNGARRRGRPGKPSGENSVPGTEFPPVPGTEFPRQFLHERATNAGRSGGN
jgi:putative transposase